MRKGFLLQIFGSVEIVSHTWVNSFVIHSSMALFNSVRVHYMSHFFSSARSTVNIRMSLQEMNTKINSKWTFCFVTLQSVILLVTSESWSRLRARALRAPVFLGPLTCIGGRCAPPAPTTSLLLPLKIILIYRENPPKNPSLGKNPPMCTTFHIVQ